MDTCAARPRGRRRTGGAAWGSPARIRVILATDAILTRISALSESPRRLARILLLSESDRQLTRILAVRVKSGPEGPGVVLAGGRLGVAPDMCGHEKGSDAPQREGGGRTETVHQQQLGRQTRSRAADDGGRRGRCSARGGGEARGGGAGLRGRDTPRTRGAIRNLRPAFRAPRPGFRVSRVFFRVGNAVLCWPARAGPLRLWAGAPAPPLGQ